MTYSQFFTPFLPAKAKWTRKQNNKPYVYYMMAWAIEVKYTFMCNVKNLCKTGAEGIKLKGWTALQVNNWSSQRSHIIVFYGRVMCARSIHVIVSNSNILISYVLTFHNTKCMLNLQSRRRWTEKLKRKQWVKWGKVKQFFQ